VKLAGRGREIGTGVKDLAVRIQMVDTVKEGEERGRQRRREEQEALSGAPWSTELHQSGLLIHALVIH
jgi:hypothetical protein